MSSEREKILQMVADGTITVAEADQLLECLTIGTQQDGEPACAGQPQTTESAAQAPPPAPPAQPDAAAKAVSPPIPPTPQPTDAETSIPRERIDLPITADSTQRSYPVEQIRGLSISWISGEIELKRHSGKEINITEYSANPLSEIDQMDISDRDGIIQIKWDKRGGVFSLSSITSLIGVTTLSKQLVIEVPDIIADQLELIDCSSVSSKVIVSELSGGNFTFSTVSGGISTYQVSANFLKLSSVSGKVHANTVAANNLVVKSTSGAMTLENIEASSLRYEGVSGKVSAFGQCKTLHGTTISGRQEINLTLPPEDCSFESVSGKIHLYLPENEGMQISFTSMSGKFQSEFPVDFKMNGKKSGTASSGTGQHKIKMKSISGGMLIGKDQSP